MNNVETQDDTNVFAAWTVGKGVICLNEAEQSLQLDMYRHKLLNGSGCRASALSKTAFKLHCDPSWRKCMNVTNVDVFHSIVSIVKAWCEVDEVIPAVFTELELAYRGGYRKLEGPVYGFIAGGDVILPSDCYEWEDAPHENRN